MKDEMKSAVDDFLETISFQDPETGEEFTEAANADETEDGEDD